MSFVFFLARSFCPVFEGVRSSASIIKFVERPFFQNVMGGASMMRTFFFISDRNPGIPTHNPFLAARSSLLPLRCQKFSLLDAR